MFVPGEAEKVGSCKTRAVKVEIPRLDPMEPDSKTRWTPGSELGRDGALQFGHVSVKEQWATRTAPRAITITQGRCTK